jgi:tetratricopeptide (TPR) repeat protein
MLVKTALEYLDSLAAEAGNDPELELELAVAYQRVGDVLGDPWEPNLGRSDEAMKSYEKAMAIAQKLALNNKDDIKVQRALARDYFKIGTLRAETGDKDNSYGLLRQSIGLSEEVARRSGEKSDATYLTDCYVRLGDVYLDTGDARGGLEFYRKSLELSKLWAQKLKDDNALAAVGSDYGHVGEALGSVGDLPNAIENYRQTMAIYEDIVRRNPNNNHYSRDLGVVYNWLGHLSGDHRYVNASDKAAAIGYYRKALAIAEEAASADPKSASARSDLINYHFSMGDILSESEPRDSMEHYRKALALIEPLLASSPNEYRHLRRQAFGLRGVAVPLRKLGDRATALKDLRQSLQIMRQLSSRFPTNPQAGAGLHASLLALADALAEAGDYASALDHFRQSLTVAETLASAARSDVYARWRLADSYDGLANLSEWMSAGKKTPPAERETHRSEACAWRRKSFDVWDSWSQYGVSSGFDSGKRARAAQALAKCDASMGRIPTPQPH